MVYHLCCFAILGAGLVQREFRREPVDNRSRNSRSNFKIIKTIEIALVSKYNFLIRYVYSNEAFLIPSCLKGNLIFGNFLMDIVLKCVGVREKFLKWCRARTYLKIKRYKYYLVHAKINERYKLSCVLAFHRLSKQGKLLCGIRLPTAKMQHNVMSYVFHKCCFIFNTAFAYSHHRPTML